MSRNAILVVKECLLSWATFPIFVTRPHQFIFYVCKPWLFINMVPFDMAFILVKQGIHNKTWWYPSNSSRGQTFHSITCLTISETACIWKCHVSLTKEGFVFRLLNFPQNKINMVLTKSLICLFKYECYRHSSKQMH